MPSVIDELMATFGQRKKPKTNNTLDKLLAVPKRDKGKNQTHFQFVKPHWTHQADLLELPNDNGFKYVLVVVDQGTRLIDAEPLKSKSSSAVRDAFIAIYDRDVLPLPKRLEVDSGSEFKGVVKKLFDDNEVAMRVAEPDRHRQQAIVERANQTIGKVLNKRMVGAELLTGETSREWTDDLPELIVAMNKRAKQMFPKKIKSIKDLKTECEGDACKLLQEGDKVRVMLDRPIDNITGKRLFGKFRSSDVRWDTKIRTVKKIQLIPGMTPTYRLDGPNNGLSPVSYTKNQLQLVGNETAPNAKVFLKNQKQSGQFVIDKLLQKKKINNRWSVLVKWLAFDKPTWEYYSVIKQDVPDLVKEFESNL